jgi:hypothetical protein
MLPVGWVETYLDVAAGMESVDVGDERGADDML